MQQVRDKSGHTTTGRNSVVLQLKVEDIRMVKQLDELHIDTSI